MSDNYIFLTHKGGSAMLGTAATSISINRSYAKYFYFVSGILATILLLVSFNSDAQSNCPKGLVHYFGMDETDAGNKFKDYTSSTIASCVNCPSPTTGLFAGAQQFDGNNNGLSVTDVNKFEWGPNSNFTIEFWMQISGNSSTNRVVIGRVGSESQMIWWVGVDPNGYAAFELRDRKNTGFVMGGNGIGNIPVKVNDGKWHHIAVVRDGILRRNKLYVDGFTVGNFDADYIDNFESAAPVTIGFLNKDNKYRFNGKLDELMVYDRALGENEMRSRYNRGVGNYCGPHQVKPVIVSQSLTFGVVGQYYMYDVNATGNPSPTFSLITSPEGMTINPSTGEITWMPTANGSFNVTVKAYNNAGENTQSFKIDVKQSNGEISGLIHHWNMQETTGSNFKDYYTPYLASSQGASRPTPTRGAVAGGQYFDGKENGLDITESYNFDWESNSSFSIELWMRTSTNSSGNTVLIGRDGKDSEVHWWIGLNNVGKAVFTLLDLSWKGIEIGGSSGPSINDGKWHQLVVVRNGNSGNTTLYVDGEEKASGSYNYQNGFASRTPVNIGYLNDGDGYHYKGDLDEVKLFGRVLSSDEIRERYRSVYNALTEISFLSGRYIKDTVKLDWVTALEADCKSFSIEHSADGKNFEKIGEVTAAGNSNVKLEYNFIDDSPFPDKTYYRVKINNINNSFTYSKIVKIEDRLLSASSFILYPNPTISGSEVNVEITKLEKDKQVIVFISDLSGKVLVRKEFDVDPYGNLQFSLPVNSSIQSGIYNISVINNLKTLSRKLVIIN